MSDLKTKERFFRKLIEKLEESETKLLAQNDLERAAIVRKEIVKLTTNK